MAHLCNSGNKMTDSSNSFSSLALNIHSTIVVRFNTVYMAIMWWTRILHVMNTGNYHTYFHLRVSHNMMFVLRVKVHYTIIRGNTPTFVLTWSCPTSLPHLLGSDRDVRANYAFVRELNYMRTLLNIWRVHFLCTRDRVQPPSARSSGCSIGFEHA